LLEYREGRGLVLFCQLDVTGRTESEPAAEKLACNILRYVDGWQPSPRRRAFYAGEAAGRAWLAECGVEAGAFDSKSTASNHVLIAGPGAGTELAPQAAAIAQWIADGGRVLALKLPGAEANAFLPTRVTTRPAEHIAAWFPAFGANSLLAGVSPADVHNRAPRDLPLVEGGATTHGDGVLAGTESILFSQIVPWDFDPEPKQFNQRRTFVRSSFCVSRILANLGVSGSTPLPERFSQPANSEDSRWQDGLYLTRPTEWDDPYRFFRW
jgi:hypothetical protein